MITTFTFFIFPFSGPTGKEVANPISKGTFTPLPVGFLVHKGDISLCEAKRRALLWRYLVQKVAIDIIPVATKLAGNGRYKQPDNMKEPKK